MVYAGDQRGGFSVRGFREALAVFVDSYDRLVINAGLLYGEANEMAAEIVDAAEHVVLAVPYGELSSAEASAYADLISAGGVAVTVLALDDMPLESAA